jgi:aminoglycoside phosphotransferase (APT) family kinase protein
MTHRSPTIDVALIQKLIATQFPKWRHLAISPVAQTGWDNRTFHLGKEMTVRMPSAADYALQVDKEQRWLPKLAPLLPLTIPTPIAIGRPDEDYPWPWSIYRWIEGEAAASAPIGDLSDFARTLGAFLVALQGIDSTGGPLPGLHSFYRGGPLATYDAETRNAIAALKARLDVDTATQIWETALSTSWNQPPVWLHGDISAGNLLVQRGRLTAVIDFGQLAIGDPACDLAIAWTLFKDASREAFQATVPLDRDTWARGRGWALWKALIVAAGFTNPNNTESNQCWRIIDEILRN